jgi:hypothetical protein
MLKKIAGDAADQLSMDPNTGKVSFNSEDVDTDANEGADLIGQLVDSDYNYGFALGATEKTAGKDRPVGDLPGNLDNGPDRRFGPRAKVPGDRPPAGFDDQVTINPAFHFAEPSGRRVVDYTVAFHELAEAYSKVDQGHQYSYDLQVVNGAVSALVAPGAHERVAAREEKLRDQRPSLQSTGRAGAENLQVIRDPH